MLRATFKSLLAHKLRLVLSGIAVVLGVAFVAGTFVFSDTLNKTFTDLLNTTSADVTVQKETSFEQSVVSGSSSGAANSVPASLLEEIRAIDGVAAAEGDVYITGVYLVDQDGDAITTGGAPGIGINWYDTDGLTSSTLVEGDAPQGAGEVAIDSQTADKGDFAVGDTVPVLTPDGRTEAEVVGIFRFGESGGLAGATLTAFDTATAQELVGLEDAYTTITVDAEAGVSEEQLRANVAAALPDGYEALTRTQVVDDGVQEIESALSFIDYFLLAFAFIALFVGSFIILNTFSMIVTQRTRELALLRAVGASRRQVSRSVLLEALLVGLVGSIVGVGVGIGLASLLRMVFGNFGLQLDGGLVIEPSTVVVSMLVGVVVTVVAAYFPARRASKVPPVAAMRDDLSMPEKSLRVRAVVGGVLAVVGALALAGSFSSDSTGTAFQLLGLGAVVLLAAAIVLSPVLSRPVLAVLGGWMPRAFGTVGRMAQENARRNPRRTSATASALMIGIALVATFTVLGASMRSTVVGTIERSLEADFVISNSVGTPFSTELAEQVAEQPGVALVATERFGNAQADGSTAWVAGQDPEVLREAVVPEWVAGGPELSEDTIVLDEPTAEARGVSVGDTLEMTFPYGGTQELTVAGIFERSPALSPYVITKEAFSEAGYADLDNYVYVRAEEGADLAQLRSSLESVTAGYPIVELFDQQEFQDDIIGQVNQLLYIIYMLLVLAIVIAVLGIINTLALSVIERTREIGLLRAVGMSRRQLRRMVRLESVVIAVYGAVLGLGLGVLFGVGMQQALAGEGIDKLAVPTTQLVVFLVLAAVVGVLAAVWPARRAARLDVLRAITTE